MEGDEVENVCQEQVEVIEVNEDDDMINDLDLDDNDEDDDNAPGLDKGDEADMEDIKDDASMVFTKHKDSVFTVRVFSNTNSLAVTGGQDDTAYVWSTSSGEVCLECKGHKDSVTSVGFSNDGQYVASADLGGLIKVWKTDTKKEVWSFECSDIEWLEWHQVAPVLLVGTSDGECWMWKIPSGDTKTFQGHGSTSTCGRVFTDGKQMVVGYEDGSIKIWDLKTATALHNVNGRDGHSSSVVCVDCYHDNNLVMTGSTDVTSRLINTNTGKVMGVFHCGVSEEEENSVETCGFSKIQNYAATGTLAGELAIWDVPTQTRRNSCKHPAGIVKLLWDATQPVIYTACLDGAVRLWDSRSGQLTSTWSGHHDAILDFDVTLDGKTLVTVSEDTTARVYNLKN